VTPRPIVLIIRDGWGHNPDHRWDKANALCLANIPVERALLATYPHTLVHTSGFDVGLPEGTMGNSEVGHQNIGAGRIVDQDSVAITKAIRGGEFFANKVLNSAMDHVLARGSALHVMGLCSDIGVHSLLEHLYGCLELAKRRGVERVFLHAFMDGRDSPPTSGRGFMADIEAKMKQIGVGQTATVMGRYWAMDRDNRWDRVQKAYRAITGGDGPRFASAAAAIEHYYARPAKPNMVGDEFITPSIISDDGQNPRAVVRDGDAVIFFNYRGDRPRELTKAFVYEQFPYVETDKTGATVTQGFERARKLDVFFVTLTAYEQGLPVNVAYPKPPKMVNILGEYLAAHGRTQFRCAETEKYPHVTFFFNDYREQPFAGEDRALIASPKVATYDLQPEMSAFPVAEETVRRIDSGKYDLVVVNFANGDMVGHTGSIPAAVKAVEAVDQCVGRIIEATRLQGGTALVTSDHGNCEQMIDPQSGGPHTAHTTYDVDLILVDDRYKGKQLAEGGRLADLAPTILDLMGLPKPPEMTGRSLLPA